MQITVYAQISKDYINLEDRMRHRMRVINLSVGSIVRRSIESRHQTLHKESGTIDGGNRLNGVKQRTDNSLLCQLCFVILGIIFIIRLPIVR